MGKVNGHGKGKDADVNTGTSTGRNVSTETFQRVIPILVYRDIPAAHDYLVRVFGFEPGGVDRDPEGNPVHGEVRAGNHLIWLHRETEDNRLVSPERVDMAGAGLVIHVPDVDAHCARVRAAAGRIQYGPVDQPYGQREYEALDLEGHRWWFATPL